MSGSVELNVGVSADTAVGSFGVGRISAKPTTFPSQTKKLATAMFIAHFAYCQEQAPYGIIVLKVIKRAPFPAVREDGLDVPIFKYCIYQLYYVSSSQYVIE
ncbi:hypothetical protein MMC28_007610 [Mycoblastus sanguinarius]|nr:hypothetical protein [Mycoblastus sanguinarius]